jgi:hypothetical protein
MCVCRCGGKCYPSIIEASLVTLHAFIVFDLDTRLEHGYYCGGLAKKILYVLTICLTTYSSIV